MKIQTIKVSIEGTTPMMMNNFHAAAAMAATSGIRSSRKNDEDPRDVCELKLYKNAAGQCVIPQPNILRCLIDAGTFIKIGKSKATTMKSTIVTAYLAIPGTEFVLRYPSPWSVDARAVVIPATGGRILGYRPRFDIWGLDFDLEVDIEEFSPKTARELVDIAGKRIGLGDFRPARKGPFGQFRVDKWVVQV